MKPDPLPGPRTGLRILMVDDMPERWERLREVVQLCGIETESMTWRTHAVAIRPSDVVRADLVFLDHDLCLTGDDEPCPSPPRPYQRGCACPTGADLVRRLLMPSDPIAIPPGVRPRFVVHSVNRRGAGEMAHLLRRAGHTAHLSPFDRWPHDNPSGTLWQVVTGLQAGDLR